jgi:MFS family permease
MKAGLSVPLAGTWRTPLFILICGCGIAVISFGLRSTFGFFLTPMSEANGWGRDVFALAIAIEMLVWGAAQPFAGGLADRFGASRVLTCGSIIYAIGIAWMAYSSTPAAMYASAGVVVGFGLAGASFLVVLGAFAKLMPEHLRSLSFGAGTAAGSFGQFLFSPLAVALIDNVGWKMTLLLFIGVVLIMAPLSLALLAPRKTGAAGASLLPTQSLKAALTEAFGHRSYVLLVLGYFTCGFQLFFIGVHLPAYLVDRGLPASIGGWTLAIIGLFNIVGSLAAGWLGNVMPRRYILSVIYFGRALAIAAFVLLPASAASTLVFGAVMGLLWLSTVPPTSSLIALMFGQRWLNMLIGISFFSHQVGGFLGVWLGGLVFEQTGSYDVIWWFAVFFGVASAIINLPIVEKPVVRPAAAAA